MVKFFVNGKEIEGKTGESLLSVLHNNNIKIKANCEGNGACGTCQIKLDEEHYNKLEISDDEMDILEKQTNLTPTSRLACQLILNEDFDGAIVEILNK